MAKAAKSSVATREPFSILLAARAHMYADGIEYTEGRSKACRLIDAVLDVLKAEVRLKERCLLP